MVSLLASARSPVGRGLFQLRPNSVRSTVAVTVTPSRCMPLGSAIGGETVPVTVTGFVTPLMVISPSASIRSPFRLISSALKRSSGTCSASKKSGLCRWALRSGFWTSTLATTAEPSSVAPSSATASDAVTSWKRPLYVPTM